MKMDLVSHIYIATFVLCVTFLVGIFIIGHYMKETTEIEIELFRREKFGNNVGYKKNASH